MRLAKYPCVLHMNTVILYMFNLQLCVLKVGIRKQLRKSKKRKKNSTGVHIVIMIITQKKNAQNQPQNDTIGGCKRIFFKHVRIYTSFVSNLFHFSQRSFVVGNYELFVFKAYSNYIDKRSIGSYENQTN